MRVVTAIFSLFIAIVACSSPEEIPTFVVGEDLSESNVRILSIDTFDLELSTFKFDSIVTSGSDRLLVGRYLDSAFGTVESSAFLELGGATFEIPEEGELDSIALILGYDRYFYSDTTTLAQINVHRVTDDIKPDDVGAFFNTTEIPYQSLPIITRNFKPRPLGEDSLHISLPKAFGQEVFHKIQQGLISDNAELINEFKGITIRPGDNTDAAIIGFSTDLERTYMRFFYSVSDEFGKEEFIYDLTENPTSIDPAYFNSIRSELAGTGLEEIELDQEISLPSTNTNQQSYVQSGIGIATRIQFPTIKKLYDIPGTGTLLIGNLLIRPARNSFDGFLSIPDSLSVNILDQNNDVIEELASADGQIYGVLRNGDDEFDRDQYEIPVGLYLERKLNETFNVDDALVLFPLDFGSAVSRIVLSGEQNQQFEAKLIVTYAIYDPE
ncbi:MAG: DUF4270 family protein [Bacteroidota bacterium]